MSESKNEPSRRALGKGLESLLPKRTPVAPAERVQEGVPVEIALEVIERNPYQTRTRFDERLLQELAASIRVTGVIQPIVVRLLAQGGYQLITGERRLLASRIAGRKTIPTIIRVASNEETMEMTIVENLQRADLNPMEQARAYERLSREFKMTQEQMATRTGKERASVANFLRLLRLPSPIQEMIEEGALSFGHARTLLSLGSPESMLEAAAHVQTNSMSVRQTEVYVQRLLGPEMQTRRTGRKSRIEQADPNIRAAQDLLEQLVGLKVKIEDKGGRGRIIIEYSRLQDFDMLLSLIKAND